MRITPEQEAILNSFVCERLSADEINKDLIKAFESTRGSSLVDYFQRCGLQEDIEGNTAYYVIKTKQNEILMFFSLKCGVLYEPLSDENEIKQDFQRIVTLLQAISNADGKVPELDEASELLKNYRVGNRISSEDLIGIIKKADRKKDFFMQLSDDKASEPNEKITRVRTTHPGIELVHFCVNDNMKTKWKEYHFGHTMGETLFWKFIVTKFFAVQELAGCEYAFLFAADLSEDRSLVNYYDVSLKFKLRLDLGTNKPFYDFCCIFMCQELNEMKEEHKSFFENFNIDEGDIIV